MTPLAITVLALLFERDMHPYEMYQLLRQRRRDMLVKIRPGSLYHTVSRLERDGFVVAVGTDRDGNRPERTTYALTANGRSALTERVADMLGSPTREYPRFPFALSEAHNLDADTVARLLRERIGHLRTDLVEIEAGRDGAAGTGKPRMFFLHLDYLAATIRAEIDWLTLTVAELDDGILPWVVPCDPGVAGELAARPADQPIT